MCQNHKDLDNSILPELYKLLKKRDHHRERHDNHHEKEKHEYHNHHPNEKPCSCHEHEHKRCHHGYEEPYHNCRNNHLDGHHCDCGHHHHHHDNCGDHHHHNRDCGCGHSHHNHCRRFLCEDDFRLRLGGLLNNLNFKLRQHIGCMVELELEDSKKIEAEICFVGTNFVEVKKYGDVTEPDPEPGEDDPESPDIQDQPNDMENDNEMDDAKEKEKHCYSWIIPVDKIKYVQVYHGEKYC